MIEFDPEAHFNKDSSIFGFPKDIEAALYLLPTAWEPTTSFKKGCSMGPKALFEASKQMDLYHPYFKKVYERGVRWHDELDNSIQSLNDQALLASQSVQNQLDLGKKASADSIQLVNRLSEEFNKLVYDSSLELLKSKKHLGLIGGDHSSPFSLIKALSDYHKEPFSIVHIDAHFDFRKAYQGFEFSHASIMHNVRTKIEHPPKIFQLGIRDFSESELQFASKHSQFLLDQEFQKKKAFGHSLASILESLFEGLDENIYVSFDIDGLSPEFCPNTGTPVPGGVSYSEALFMIELLHERGHKLIGFDLVEVSPNEKQATLGEGIDEVTALRLLYALCCFSLSSPP